MPLLPRFSRLLALALAGIIVSGAYAENGSKESAPAAGFWKTSATVPSSLKKGFEAITIPDAKTWLGALAGPEMEGRGTGEPGYELAMNYMADHFRKMGLKPIGDNGTYFQYNDFWRSRANPARLAIKSSNGLLLGQDIGGMGAGQGMAQAQAVYLKIADDTQLDQATSAKLSGKIVILEGGENNRRMRFTLNRAGAAAVITIAENLEPITWRGSRTEPQAGNNVGRFQLRKEKALSLLSDSDKAKVNAAAVGVPQELETEVFVRSELEIEKVKVANVVALLEGSDPVLKNDIIGVGAHLDHLGRSGNQIYYGADDDGSGNAALLGVAKGLTSNPVKPKRSVLFMAFYGEEMGLLGSAFLAQNPPFPLKQWVAELQMDMVGRNSSGQQRPGQVDKDEENVDTMRLVGSKRISTELDQIIQEQNKYVGFRFLYDAEDVYTRSDHYNFAKNGIPIAFFFDGFHPDYHQVTDTVDKINFTKLTNTARLVYLTIHEIGNRPNPPAKDVPQK